MNLGNKATAEVTREYSLGKRVKRFSTLIQLCQKDELIISIRFSIFIKVSFLHMYLTTEWLSRKYRW